jgi:uncharacterized delta-60 repeat protein
MGGAADRGGITRAPLIVAVALVSLLSAAVAVAAPGAADTRFGNRGLVQLSADTAIYGAASQTDGKIVLAGVSGRGRGAAKLLVTRLTAAGKPDRSFNGGRPYLGATGTVGSAVAIQPDGKIVVAGSLTDNAGVASQGMLVTRLTAAGRPDRRFSGDGVNSILTGQAGQGLSVGLQRDGKIVVAGSASLAGPTSDGFARVAAARFSANGAPDGRFGQGGAAVIDLGRLSVANSLAVQPNGRIVLGGSQRANLQTTNFLAARLTPAGALDRSFNGSGSFIQQLSQGAGFSAANAVGLASGGKIVFGGSATSTTSGANLLVVRLSGNGRLDGGFGSGGVVQIPAARNQDQFTQTPLPGARALAISGGEIFLAGHYDEFGLREAAVWALRSNGALDGRFGQGGRTTYVLGGNSQFDALAFVPDGDLVPAGQIQPDPIAPPLGFAGGLDGFPVPVSVTAKAPRSAKIGRAIRKGIPVTLTCNEACRLAAVLKVGGATVAKARGSLRDIGSKVLKLRFTKAGKRKVAGKRRVAGKIVATAKSGRSNDRVTKGIILRR